MIDHRRIQRTLFRMQHDAAFAADLRAGAAGAVDSTRLTESDRRLVLSAQAAAITADASGKRRAQFLRNVSSEFALSVVRALLGSDRDLLESFTGSRWFHEAVRDDLRLPLAFGEHASERAARSGDPVLRAFASMERAMAHARRGPFQRPAPPAGGLVLGPAAEVLELPEGAVAAAEALRVAIDEEGAGSGAGEQHGLPRLRVHARRTEHVLVLGDPSGRPSPHRLGEARIELLSPLAGGLLLLARSAPGRSELDAFCATHGVERAELGEFVAGLVQEGIVVAAADADAGGG